MVLSCGGSYYPAKERFYGSGDYDATKFFLILDIVTTMEGQMNNEI